MPADRDIAANSARHKLTLPVRRRFEGQRTTRGARQIPDHPFGRFRRDPQAQRGGQGRRGQQSDQRFVPHLLDRHQQGKRHLVRGFVPRLQPAHVAVLSAVKRQKMPARPLKFRLFPQDGVVATQRNVKPGSLRHPLQSLSLQREFHVQLKPAAYDGGSHRHIRHHKRRPLRIGQIPLNLEHLLKLFVGDVGDVDELAFFVPQIQSARFDFLHGG